MRTALKDGREKHPERFKKRVFNLGGLDNYLSGFMSPNRITLRNFMKKSHLFH